MQISIPARSCCWARKLWKNCTIPAWRCSALAAWAATRWKRWRAAAWGPLDLIDDDKVCLTNLNRQIIATRRHGRAI